MDGQPLDLAYSQSPAVGYQEETSTAQAMIDSICGQGFLTGSPAPALATNFTLSALLAPNNAAGHTSEDVAIADFNGDGIPDSAVLTGRGIFVTLRGAAGTTLSSTLYPVTGIDVAQNIVTADFNGDGLPDLAVTQGTVSTSANPFPAGNVVILFGKRDGTFGPPVTIPVGPVGNSYLASGDFNGDGVTDLALTDSVSTGPGQVALLLGKGDGSFGPAVLRFSTCFLDPTHRREVPIICAPFEGVGGAVRKSDSHPQGQDVRRTWSGLLLPNSTNSHIVQQSGSAS